MYVGNCPLNEACADSYSARRDHADVCPCAYLGNGTVTIADKGWRSCVRENKQTRPRVRTPAAMIALISSWLRDPTIPLSITNCQRRIYGVPSLLYLTHAPTSSIRNKSSMNFPIYVFGHPQLINCASSAGWPSYFTNFFGARADRLALESRARCGQFGTKVVANARRNMKLSWF